MSLWIIFLLIAIACLVIGVVQARKDHRKRRDEQQSAAAAQAKEREREAGEREEEAREKRRRQKDLDDLEFKLQAAKKLKDLKDLEGQPAPAPNPDEERFSQYQTKKVIDARQKLFDTVFLPTKTVLELERAFDKQRTEIDRDSTLTEAQKDQIGKLLRQNYRKAIDRVKGRTNSIYEDET